MNEIWKKIEGFEQYEISNNGQIRKNNKILKGQLNGCYKEIKLTSNSVRKNFKIHRLVAKHFLSNPLNLPCVNHKDEDTSNNAVENLEWCTYKYNTNYGTCILRRSKNHEKAILQYDKNGIVKKWNSIKEASDTLAIDASSITKCAKGKRKSAGGYIWKYEFR